MSKKIFQKTARSIIKLILPFLAKLFLKLRVNRRVINYLSEKSFDSNNYYDFSSIIQILLKKEKIFSMDVGAQGGFNSELYFNSKYNRFFEPIMIEPIEEEYKKLKNNYKYVLNKGLWSSEEKKKIYILGNRLGSSSMYEPDKDFLNIHGINEKDINKFDVTETKEVDCTTIDASLKILDINKLDYLKIDTQGSELEILKGMKLFRPVLIRTEVHVFSMYKNVPPWSDLLTYFNDLDYMACDWKGIGSHSTRIPAEMDMVFIPDYRKSNGKNIIIENKNKFVALMFIFGQLELLKKISKHLNLDSTEIIDKYEDRFFS